MTPSRMMKVWNIFKSMIKGAETPILVLSITLLAYQSYLQTKALTAQERALNAQTDQSLTAQNGDINKIFIEHPDLRPYFFDRATPPSEPGDLKYRVDTVADLHLDFIEQFENEYIKSLPNMAPGGTYWNQWNKYFATLFSRSPALCRRYREIKEFYSASLFEPLVKSNCSQI